MTYLAVLAAFLLFLAVIFVRGLVQERNKRQRFIQALYDDFGALPNRTYTPEQIRHLTGYYQKHVEDGQIDDITWNDLSMEEIFKRLNYTHSATGEEYLYYMLRSAQGNMERLAHLEDVVVWLTEHADERVRMQVYLSEMGYTGKHSLYDYIDHLDALGKRSSLKHYIADLLYLPLLLAAPAHLSLAVAGISVLGIYQIVSYFQDKRQMEPYIISFAYIMRLIRTCEKVCDMELPVCAAETHQMREAIRATKGIRRGSFWVFTASDSRTSGNPLELILDYIRMAFHLDLIIFNRMVTALREHLADTDVLITQAGFLEAAASVCAFRASLQEGFCVPSFSEGEQTAIRINNGYHLLLEKPVKNSIHATQGVLLTGSNASGKSTFLKMVAINAILAQTIHTAAADAYSAPLFSVYSSMALKDDIAHGESYYIVEIKALKRILDAVQSGKRVLGFVDEVLRGTNTVERIAASTEILKSLGKPGVLCFAATHDIELTELLQDTYDNYHFDETIQDGDIHFPYRLLAGKATTRNAIQLLALMGYSEEITEQAMQRAERFVQTGVWQAMQDNMVK
ncbi:MAG: hypothetical protein IJ747_02460 [Lachnospiraceae bacterium]|nr:hypothetical protein [Lachnospiraceae bacterium]